MPPRKSGKALARAIPPTETIEQLVLALRGHRVILDRDLAAVCGVPVKRLNEQVKRNGDRFPEDGRGRNVKYQPYAFTEHGAVMLANMLAQSNPVDLLVSIYLQ